MNSIYNYIFHYSEYRSPEQAWACIHRDGEQYYWNGSGPLKGHPRKELYELRISYGSSPDKAADGLGVFFE